ncbi:Spy/CpxP family protein refolding chaperone [Pelomonas sp. KK5]|uniref:Spy/CpxP family protein refolding chaperone n=1 Tax=Pelomonas sp. KK5 TaxID=1855730 RepID=UPI00097BD8E8|nr:Spy/CpxP family protein refolding chaperone [Pelomonas sp. KK5]
MFKFSAIRVLKAGAAASLLVLTGLAAHAEAPGMHHGPGMPMPGAHVEHMLDAVDATDQQHAQVKTIMQAAHADLKPSFEALRELHKQTMALYTAASIDANAIEAQRVKEQGLHEQISKRMSQAMIAAANVLTPAQRATLATKMAKREARMAEHMKHRQAKPAAN